MKTEPVGTPPCINYKPTLKEPPSIFPPVQITLKTKEDMTEALKHLWYHSGEITTHDMVEMVMVWASRQGEPEEKFVEVLSYALQSKVPHMRIEVSRDKIYEQELRMHRELEQMKADIHAHAQHKRETSSDYQFGSPRPTRRSPTGPLMMMEPPPDQEDE
jgi:hypothetical protein